MSQKMASRDIAKLTRATVLRQFDLIKTWTKKGLVDLLSSKQTSEKQISFAIKVLVSYKILEEKDQEGIIIYELPEEAN